MADMNLAEFLEARYAEREAAAKAAKRDESGNWLASVDGEVFADEDRYVCSAIEVDATHIMLSDPASVLADIAAKRAILELAGDADEIERALQDEVAHRPQPDEVSIGDDIRRALAAPFAAHPDYQEGWKP